tara:strand:- start:323 stop:1066 length:744 start_codon:yes stop_codon:yes gene_type:complete
MTDQSATNAFETPQATPEQTPASTSAFEDQLKMIKNETGEQKYDSVPKALDALAHSQSFIGQLKDETAGKDATIAQLQEELAKRTAVGEVVEKLTAQQAQPEATPQVSGLDEQGVLDIVSQYSSQQQAAQIASSNEKSVSDALYSKFGDKSQEIVVAKAAELGMSVEGLKALSQTSPQAALQLFQAQGGAPTPRTTTGSVNIPPSMAQEDTLQPPEKSLLRGASTKDQVDYLHKIRDSVYRKHNVET